MSAPKENRSHPRIKRGKMVMATKDGASAANVDRLLVNSYMARNVTEKPDYWPKLLGMLYGEGRLRNYTNHVEDIVDKFSFLLLARDQVLVLEETRSPDKRFFVKYFAYTFVFLTKSLLDSLAVFLNEIYGLGFKGGEIDFKKGKFVSTLKEEDASLGALLEGKEAWILYASKYRDEVIHRHGLYVGALPNVPEEMTDAGEIERFILQEHHYMPTDSTLTSEDIIAEQEVEFIKVTELINEWLAEVSTFFDAVLRTFATKFELVHGTE